MIAPADARSTPVSDRDEARFLEMLPPIEWQLSYAFRRLKAEAREEAMQDGVVNCYFAGVRLLKRGRGHQASASVPVKFAIHQHRSGRK